MDQVNKIMCILYPFDHQSMVFQRRYPIARAAASFKMEPIWAHCLKQHLPKLIIAEKMAFSRSVIIRVETCLPVPVPVLLVTRLTIPCHSSTRNMTATLQQVVLLHYPQSRRGS